MVQGHTFQKSRPPFEGVHGIRFQVTLDVMSHSPFVSQTNKREFGSRV